MDEEKIFLEAVAIDSPDERRAFLDEACGRDEQLRRSVDALLRHHDDAGSFLESPPDAFVATIDTRAVDAVDEVVRETSLGFLKESDKPGCLGTLGSYEVIEIVGRGGMGIVLRAFDQKLNRVVAIKVMAPELAANPMAAKRFLREARAAAAVSHDHVITIHAVDEDNRPPFIVMEYIDGQSLQEKIDRTGSLELTEILRIGLQIAQGLAAAHAQGLIHRDIKPANILLENGVARVKLTDFGLARAVDDVSVTQTGQIAGTPQFMSPEQAQGHTLDFRSDLFSLGSVLYTMCTGRPPFRADSAIAMLRRVTDDDPRTIREVNSDAPDWLEAIVVKLLAKDPAERFQSCDEVTDLLGRHLAHLQHPATAPKPKDLVPPISRPGFPSHAPAARRSDHQRPSRSRWKTIVVAMAALVLACVSLGTIIRIATDKGELVIEVDDPEVTVRISQDGHETKLLKEGGSRVTVLRSGDYNIEVVGDEDSFEITQSDVMISRGAKQVVRIRRKANSEKESVERRVLNGEGKTTTIESTIPSRHVSASVNEIPGLEVAFSRHAKRSAAEALIASIGDGKRLWFYDEQYDSPSDPGAFVTLVRTDGKLAAKWRNHGWSTDWLPITDGQAIRYLWACRKENTSGADNAINYVGMDIETSRQFPTPDRMAKDQEAERLAGHVEARIRDDLSTSESQTPE